jgi:hydroxyacylglutathione hydrolase
MRVVAVPCFQDNYAYLLIDEGSAQAAVVDPSESAPVLAAVLRERVKLVAILSTHHHFDHVGGNAELCAAVPGLAVYAHRSDHARTPAVTDLLEDGARFTLGAISIEALHVPGHTLGALTFVASEGDERWAFTGDTLFLGGCGRLFEGTPGQMHASLTRLAALPPDTRVACGHEYTASNLAFAAHVEPANERLRARIEAVAALRAEGRPTVPGTIAEERATNPFLRARDAAVIAYAGLAEGAGAVDVFAKLRLEKDTFRG